MSRTNGQEGLDAILAALGARTKYDFRGYRKGTLQRRIDRRMRLLQVDGHERYLELLLSQPVEMDRLAKDLLIGVTSFFRDAAAFDALTAHVLTALANDRDQRPIRIWVPACSTGEEAYSIAIVLAEQMARARSARDVRIFPTDVDEEALSVARAGCYPESVAMDVAPERLARFFTHDDRRYTIVKSLRNTIFFASHDLTKDPPFSRLDLVSCRHLLIYLEPQLQETLLSRFHFALNPGGHLFLGSAEAVGPTDGLFVPVSKRWRILKRPVRQPRSPGLIEIELAVTKQQHTQMLQELEASRQDLKTANDEILSLTEELQSTNQDLTASKEELQVANDALTTMNAQLEDRVRELRTAREQAADDLRRMTELHELSMERPASADLRYTLENVVRVAVRVTGADMGTLQRCDDAGMLAIVAQTGFEGAFLDAFAHVEPQAGSAWGAAMSTGRRVRVEDARETGLFAGEGSRAAVQSAGVSAVQSTPLFDRGGRLVGMLSTHYRQPHAFGEAELRWLDLVARHASDAIEQEQTNALLEQSRRELETRVADRTRWLSLMHDVTRAINEASTWDGALHRVLRCLCEAEDWQVGFLYLPDPQDPSRLAPVVSCFADERLRPFHDLTMRTVYARGELLPGRVYAENRPLWAANEAALLTVIPIRSAAARAAGLRAGVALPVAVGGDVVAVLELFSERVHPPDEQLTTLMHDVGDQISRVLERERATARMAELVWREQQDLLHTLHDSLGQTLTGLGMLSTGLRQRVAATDAGAADTAAEIARQAQQALDQVRQLAKRLFPIEVEAVSLVAALRDLASATESLHKVAVRVEAGPLVGLHSGKVATELYRIGQEAVTNSVKHARATTITIRLEDTAAATCLQIADDGVGMPQSDAGEGAGLRIMRYRAASIGASLTVERGAGGGTVVTCTLRESPGSKQGAA